MVICELYFHLFTVAHHWMMLNICICLVAGKPQTQDGFLYRWIDAAGVSRAWIARRYCFGVSIVMAIRYFMVGLPVIP
jgi:hypothetical protein